MSIIYFDNSATTKPYKEVIDEVVDCMENYFGNPSSAHKLGIEAEKKIKTARERLSALIGANSKEIIFTSGGSEANNTVLKGLVNKGEHIITSKIEHPSILNTIKSLEENGIQATYLNVDSNGVIDINELKSSIKDNTRLVTIMHVNNEIGSIQPIKEIVKVVREKNSKTKIHIDAVQSLGKILINVKSMDVDFMSFSAHKIHGPRGVGALYIKNNLILQSLISGGGQETGLRSGTENLPGISGFGVASLIVKENLTKNIEKVNTIKKYFVDRLSEIENIKINSEIDEHHLGNVLNVSFLGVRGEVFLHALEDYNIYVSTGSACSAKKTTSKNYVLPAIGLNDKEIEGAIRFSFSHTNSIEEVDRVMDGIKKVLPFLRRIKK